MAWNIEWDESAFNTFKKLGKHTQKEIDYYLRDRMEKSKDPRAYGRQIMGSGSGVWRYTVGTYSIIFHIGYDELVVLVIKSRP